MLWHGEYQECYCYFFLSNTMLGQKHRSFFICNTLMGRQGYVIVPDFCLSRVTSVHFFHCKNTLSSCNARETQEILRHVYSGSSRCFSLEVREYIWRMETRHPALVHTALYLITRWTQREKICWQQSMFSLAVYTVSFLTCLTVLKTEPPNLSSDTKNTN